jgi:hypothetical protein
MAFSLPCFSIDPKLSPVHHGPWWKSRADLPFYRWTKVFPPLILRASSSRLSKPSSPTDQPRSRDLQRKRPPIPLRRDIFFTRNIWRRLCLQAPRPRWRFGTKARLRIVLYRKSCLSQSCNGNELSLALLLSKTRHTMKASTLLPSPSVRFSPSTYTAIANQMGHMLLA